MDKVQKPHNSEYYTPLSESLKNLDVMKTNVFSFNTKWVELPFPPKEKPVR
jgi:hypothetical protein